jgi:hypothetical protein
VICYFVLAFFVGFPLPGLPVLLLPLVLLVQLVMSLGAFVASRCRARLLSRHPADLPDPDDVLVLRDADLLVRRG